jgi:hypothetical protein
VCLAATGGLDLNRCRRLPGADPYAVRRSLPLDAQDDACPLLRRTYGGQGWLSSVRQGVQDDEESAFSRPGWLREPLAGLAVDFSRGAERLRQGAAHWASAEMSSAASFAMTGAVRRQGRECPKLA